MEIQTKTPVEIVQELIALHTTRKEACERLGMPGDDKNAATALQSDQFIAELMNELSNYGDGVQSVADRDNEYQALYKKALGDMDTMQDQERTETFKAMENSLKNMYGSILETNTDLPDPLHEIITTQLGKL